MSLQVRWKTVSAWDSGVSAGRCDAAVARSEASRHLGEEGRKSELIQWEEAAAAASSLV